MVEPEVVMEEVESDCLFYNNSGGGLTVSGGEPFSQFDFLKDLFKLARKKNISTALDTSGYVEWKKFKEILDDIDLVLYDIKHIDPTKHKQKTGVSNKRILENAKRIAKISQIKLAMRIPIIPGFNDSNAELRDIATFIKSIRVKHVDLLPYHRYATKKYTMLGMKYKLAKVREYTDQEKENLKKIFESYDFQVSIGG